MGEPLPSSRNKKANKSGEDAIVAAIESNLADYWLAMGETPEGEVHDNDSVRWEYSGGPYFNRVVGAELDQTEAERKINEVIREFSQRRAAITWLVGPSASPQDLGERLTEHGFNQYETWKGMAHDLKSLGPPPETSDDVTWVRVQSEDERKDWMDVIAQSYGLPDGAREVLYDAILHAEGAAPSSWTHNLAYIDGQPVAASTLFVSKEAAGIYLVATLPETRGHGLGTAVTWRALSQARELGCNLVVLQSTDMAQGIYEKLGFRSYCDISVYRLPAPDQTWKKIARIGARWLRRRQHSGSRRAFWGVQEDPDSSQGGETSQPAIM